MLELIFGDASYKKKKLSHLINQLFQFGGCFHLSYSSTSFTMPQSFLFSLRKTKLPKVSAYRQAIKLMDTNFSSALLKELLCPPKYSLYTGYYYGRHVETLQIFCFKRKKHER